MLIHTDPLFPYIGYNRPLSATLLAAIVPIVANEEVGRVLVDWIHFVGLTKPLLELPATEGRHTIDRRNRHSRRQTGRHVQECCGIVVCRRFQQPACFAKILLWLQGTACLSGSKAENDLELDDTYGYISSNVMLIIQVTWGVRWNLHDETCTMYA